MEPAPSRFITADNQQWVEAARAHRLLIKRCADCGRPHYYPRPFCPFCHSAHTNFVAASGQATIYTFTINRISRTPLVNAYVKLEEGPIIMTKIIDADPEQLAIGMAVALRFEDSRMGFPVPVFAPAPPRPA